MEAEKYPGPSCMAGRLADLSPCNADLWVQQLAKLRETLASPSEKIQSGFQVAI
jgi:hypothetical protein